MTIENFSLPTQRCFFNLALGLVRLLLFSAYAEVFPGKQPPYPHALSFLCLRRGVSICRIERRKTGSFSLPTQRCFHDKRALGRKERLFSAYAEVFLSLALAWWVFFSFLCLRRGVSPAYHSRYADLGFSLPTQRCFRGADRQGQAACAFLCLRRGVSVWTEEATENSPFSLPTQRCFRD